MYDFISDFNYDSTLSSNIAFKQSSNITLYLENKLGLGKSNAFVTLTILR